MKISEIEINNIEVNGIVRQLDDLGRVIIPKEMRKELELIEGSKVEIFWSKKDKIIVIKGCEVAAHENN